MKNLTFQQCYRIHKRTIENGTKSEIDDFLKTASEFNKVEVTATNQKREDYYDKLFDCITNESDRRQTIDDRLKQRTYL